MATAPGNNQPQVDDATSHAKAKQEFLKEFQGAMVTMSTTFHNRSVIRAYRRSYMSIMRNWHLATSLSRAKLKDNGAATKVQDGMLAKLKAAESKLTARLKVLEALAVAAEITDATKLIKHGNSFTDDVVMLGPVSMKYRAALIQCDQVLDLSTALYTLGELPDSEHQAAAYEVKTLLRGIDSSVRNYRIGVLKRINTEVGARPGYKGGDGTQAASGEKAGAQDAAPAEGAQESSVDAPAEATAVAG
jgi:hypothetical protein